MGADPGELAALLDVVRPMTEQAADRQAHAQLRLARRRRGGRRAARRRRRLASSTPCAAWPWTRADPATWLGGGTGGVSGPGGPRDRPGPGPRGPRSGSSSRSSAWEGSSRAATPTICVERRRSGRASALNRSAIRWPRAGSLPRCPGSQKDSLQTGHAGVGVASHSTNSAQKPCKADRLPSTPLHTASPQLEVEANSCPSACTTPKRM